MKYLAIIMSLVILAGCTTPVPVYMKFPDAPDTLVQPCAELKLLQDNPKLSDVARTTVENYTKYHECALKVESWKEWYDVQKTINNGFK